MAQRRELNWFGSFLLSGVILVGAAFGGILAVAAVIMVVLAGK